MTAVILEDENLIARDLVRKIQQAAPDVNILFHADSLESMRHWMKENERPDMMFMDIQLGDGVSFELFSEFDIKTPVVFITAYDEYAIQAFRVNGTDYLLKPVDMEELKRAINKCRQATGVLHGLPFDLESLVLTLSGKVPLPKYKEKFIVNQRKQYVAIDTAQIALFHRDNLNYLVTFEGDKYILDYQTLDEIQSLLNPHDYYRASRQSIIHINAIRAMKPLDNQTIQVFLKPPNDKFDISVGRAKASEFRKWFDR